MTHPRWLRLILLLAVGLRLGYGLTQDHRAPFDDRGSDTAWYLETGYDLLNGDDFSHLPPAPLYLIVLGAAQKTAPPADALTVYSLADTVMAQGSRIAPVAPAAIIAVRILQAALATLTVYLVYRLTRRVTDSPRAGLIAAGVIAVSPVFVIETAHIATETLYVTFIAAGLTAYVELIAGKRWGAAGLVLVGVLFGLATLTRAVALLFPLGLALHLLLVYRVRGGLARAVPLLLAYTLTVATWTAYNVVRFDRFVIGAEGLAAFLYIGATEWDDSAGVDERLAQDADNAPAIDADLDERQAAYVDAATNVIGRDPLGYIQRRVTELAAAYLQPYGTVFFAGESLRQLALDWLREDRTVGGLADVVRGDNFVPKLTIYLFHYTGLVFGLAGMIVTRARWRRTLPLIGFIAYTTLVHLVLLALPRYIFPTALVWWVFAAAILDRLLARPPDAMSAVVMADTQ